MITLFSLNASVANTWRKNEYEAALDEAVPLDIRAMIERQYHVVTENNGPIRRLRNAA